MTRLVLVNAVYFKGLWTNPFNKHSTYDQDFWVSQDSSIKVPMMHIKEKFAYSPRKDLGATVLSMDYKVILIA